jgi:hypothetical protein
MGSAVSSAETAALDPTAMDAGIVWKAIAVASPRVMVAEAVFVGSAREVTVNVRVKTPGPGGK